MGDSIAIRVEVSVTDASFSSNTVFSTVDLASPYPSAIGENNIRYMLVSDSISPAQCTRGTAEHHKWFEISDVVTQLHPHTGGRGCLQ